MNSATENINLYLYPQKVLDVLKNQMRVYNKQEISNLPKFVFLCGEKYDENKQTNRKLVQDFFEQHRKDIICVYSEKLWETFNKVGEIELLSFEEFLAELSDGIVLFLESFGTACELGAFSMRDKLIKK